MPRTRSGLLDWFDLAGAENSDGENAVQQGVNPVPLRRRPPAAVFATLDTLVPDEHLPQTIPHAANKTDHDRKVLCRPVEPSFAARDRGDDDDILEILETRRGNNPLLDFPHRREDCLKFAFAENPCRFCPKCFCYICDVPASACPEWTRGKEPHCSARHGDHHSRLKRKSIQIRRNTLRPRRQPALFCLERSNLPSLAEGTGASGAPHSSVRQGDGASRRKRKSTKVRKNTIRSRRQRARLRLGHSNPPSVAEGTEASGETAARSPLLSQTLKLPSKKEIPRTSKNERSNCKQIPLMNVPRTALRPKRRRQAPIRLVHSYPISVAQAEALKASGETVPSLPVVSPTERPPLRTDDKRTNKAIGAMRESVVSHMQQLPLLVRNKRSSEETPRPAPDHVLILSTRKCSSNRGPESSSSSNKAESSIAHNAASKVDTFASSRNLSEKEPNSLKQIKWTVEEHRTIIEGFIRCGNRWAETSKMLNGRSSVTIERYWNGYMKKKIQKYLQEKYANSGKGKLGIGMTGRFVIRKDDVEGCLHALQKPGPKTESVKTHQTVIPRNLREITPSTLNMKHSNRIILVRYPPQRGRPERWRACTNALEKEVFRASRALIKPKRRRMPLTFANTSRGGGTSTKFPQLNANDRAKTNEDEVPDPNRRLVFSSYNRNRKSVSLPRSSTTERQKPNESGSNVFHHTRSSSISVYQTTDEDTFGTLGAYWRGEPTKYAGVPYQTRTRTTSKEIRIDSFE